MDFMSNLLRKTSIKSNSMDEEKLEGDNEQKKDDEKKSENSSGGIGVSFVSNIIKSTFKGESSAAAATASETETTKKDDETLAAADATSNKTQEGGGFMSSVWKTATIFRADTAHSGDSTEKERKESISENANEKKDEGFVASHFVSNVFSKSTSLFRSDTTAEKRKGSDSTEADKEALIVDEEKEASIGAEGGENVSQKAFDSAKHFGSFLYSVANKAGQTVSATAKQIKHTVEHNTFLVDLTKEQQEFVKDHGGNIQTGDAPWIGCENESEVKEQILTLSQDRRNFVRSPPSGVHFDFTMKDMLPVALTLLKEDENLGKMRYDIVPKLVNEETFWRNYFYRVSLIKQSTSASTMNKDKKGWASSSSSSAEGPDEPSPTNPEHEFLRGTSTEDDQRKGIKQMSVDKGKKTLEEKNWEEEITKELQEFEVVSSDTNTGFDAELEKDLAAL